MKQSKKVGRPAMSKSERIRTLLRAGYDNATVAAKTGASSAYVSVVKWKMRQNGEMNAATRPIAQSKSQAKRLAAQKFDLQVQKFAEAIKPVELAKEDEILHPSHYTVGGIETWDFIEAKNLPYHLASVVKYVSRAPYKGRYLKDVQKAYQHLGRELARIEKTGVLNVSTTKL